jgi:ADP-ribose pyrophosphatase YjhB (NUDIX family)
MITGGLGQDYPVPAVRALIENSEGKILLLRRAKSQHGEGGWCLPGGKIDYGQTVEEALAQEILEETALHLLEAKFFLFQDSLPVHPGDMHCINLYFRCRVSGTIRLNEESSEYVWLGPDQIISYDIVFKNEAAIRRHFAGKV